MKNKMLILLQDQRTVFKTSELYILFFDEKKGTIDAFLSRVKKKGFLLNFVKGIWCLPNYDPFEYASILKKQSYISMETVLFKEGIFFQFYGNTISCIHNDSREYQIEDKKIIYHKIKNEILFNAIGIRDYSNYRIATPERALCDYIYIYPHASIDAPEMINEIRLKQILPIYPKKTAFYISKLLKKDVG